LQGAYKPFYRAEKLPEYLQLIGEYEQWLEDDGWNASRGLYVERIDRLRAF
jgi:hypothetical protein